MLNNDIFLYSSEVLLTYSLNSLRKLFLARAPSQISTTDRHFNVFLYDKQVRKSILVIQ